MTNLYEASTQWAQRPADERFWNLEEMRDQCLKWKAEAQEINNIGSDPVHFEQRGPDIFMSGISRAPARLLHYSFGQVCRLSSAPPGYLRSLSPDLAVRCLNSGLLSRRLSTNERLSLLIRTGDEQEEADIRAITSGRYSRIWNSDVIECLLPLIKDGWSVPPARPARSSDPRTRIATEKDCLESTSRLTGIGIKPGDLISPAGLYASDKDMFAFMVNEGIEIEDGLFRGFFMTNSEVGDAAFRLTTFLYNAVCGNHIVWGASDVKESRVVHKGITAMDKAAMRIDKGIKFYGQRGTSLDKAMIATAKSTLVGDDAESVINKIFSLGILSRKAISQSYDMSEAHAVEEKYDPRSVWGIVQGITRLSQTTNYADKRVEMDRIAGDILSTTCT